MVTARLMPLHTGKLKHKYLERTDRVRGKGDVIAYHLRQSLIPGNIFARGKG